MVPKRENLKQLLLTIDNLVVQTANVRTQLGTLYGLVHGKKANAADRHAISKKGVRSVPGGQLQKRA